MTNLSNRNLPLSCISYKDLEKNEDLKKVGRFFKNHLVFYVFV
jgi:hypothetical protein